jgi:hypothetical protein
MRSGNGAVRFRYRTVSSTSLTGTDGKTERHVVKNITADKHNMQLQRQMRSGSSSIIVNGTERNDYCDLNCRNTNR